MAEKQCKSGPASDPSGADVEDLIHDWRRSTRSHSDVFRAVTIWNVVMFFATPIAVCLFGVAGLWCEALAAAAIVFLSVRRTVRRRRTVATLALYEDERLQRVMLEALGDRSKYVRNTAILWLSVHCKAGSVKLPGEISDEQAVSLSRALHSRCGEIRAASGDLLARLPASATLGRPSS